MPGDAWCAAQDALARLEAVGAIGHWQADFASGAIDASAQARRIFGIAADDPLTLDGMRESVHPDYRPRFSNAWQRLRSGIPGTAEYRLDGAGERWCEWRAVLQTDAAGRVVGAYGTVQDISERKAVERENEHYHKEVWGIVAERTAQLRRSEERFRQIIEASPVGIELFRADGPCVMANEAVAHMAGASREQLLAQNFREIESWRKAGLVDKALAALDSGAAQRIEFAGRTAFGRAAVVDCTLAPIDIDGRLHLMLLTHDITERKESEAQLIATLDRQRNALVREVHHRIKNHLQGVIGLLADRARETPQLTPALERTIADIQLIAEAYGLQSSRGDAEVTVGQLVELAVKVTAARHPVLCRISEAAHSRTLPQPDVVPLALTINELLANAIKHSNPGARTCSIDARIDAATDTALIAVRNGPAWLPPGFDFAVGRGLGTGLELVRILLQRKGTRLGLRTESGTVVAELELTAPAEADMKRKVGAMLKQRNAAK